MKMRPRHTSSYARDHYATDAKYLGQLRATIGAGEDRSNVILSENGSPVQFSFVYPGVGPCAVPIPTSQTLRLRLAAMAPLPGAIAHVVEPCSHEEVGRVYARRHVAGVAHVEPWRHQPNVQDVRYNVGPKQDPTDIKHAVAALLGGTDPQPASRIRLWLNVRPETVYGCVPSGPHVGQATTVSVETR